MELRPEPNHSVTNRNHTFNTCEQVTNVLNYFRHSSEKRSIIQQLFIHPANILLQHPDSIERALSSVTDVFINFVVTLGEILVLH